MIWVPGRGPAPKPAAERRRRNADPIPTVEVAADGELRGPDLPEGFEWPTQTASWWRNWRLSPVAQTFEPIDWDFLLDTALLHAELWLGNAGVAAELRQRVAKFGATPEERRRLRVDVVPAGPVVLETAAAKRRTAVKRAARDPRVRLRVVDESPS